MKLFRHVAPILCMVALPLHAANIVIQVSDSAGQGFNDPTPRSPLPTNPGTTLGQQRLHVFNFAAARWGERLQSNVTIVVRANWSGFTSANCSNFSGTLGFAGPFFYANFPGAPMPNTFYPGALADAVRGSDLDPGDPDIQASFNPFVDSDVNCLGGNGFYYGTDHNPGSKIDLLNTVMHELGHGLGFSSLVNASTGALPSANVFTIFDRFLFDEATNLFWTQMNDSQRAASARSNGSLVWNSASMDRAGLSLTAGLNADNNHVRMHDPNPVQSGSSVSHFSTSASPNLLMEPSLNSSLRSGLKVDLTSCLFRDIGWTLLLPYGCPDFLSDLGVQGSDSPDPAVVGNAVTYSFIATNAGPDKATNVILGASFAGAPVTVNSVSSSQGGCTVLPCNLGVLNSGANATVTVVVTANQDGTIAANATVDADQTDAIPGDNQVAINTLVGTPDTTPDPFVLNDVSNAATGTTRTSNIITVAGISAPASISIDGADGQYRVNDGVFTSGPGTVNAGDTVRVRITSSIHPSTAVVTTLTIGGISDSFTVTTGALDTSPAPFVFPNITNANSQQVRTSTPRTLSGVNTPVTAILSGSATAQLLVNGVQVNSPATVNAGDSLALRMTASAVGGSTVSATLKVGTYTTVWSITTALDTTPSAFSFTNIGNAAPGQTVTSNTRTLSGFNAPAPVSISGHASARLLINGVDRTSNPGTVTSGNTLAIRLTSPSIDAASVSATVTVGSISATWTVTTLVDTTPAAFPFTNISNALSNQLRTSNARSLTGINAPAAVSLSGHESARLLINGVDRTSSPGTVNSGDKISLRLTASAAGGQSVSATATVGSVSSSWTVTTAIDTTPTAFTFTNVTNAMPGQIRTSNIRTIAGINSPAALGLSGDASAQILVNGASVMLPASLNAGDTIALRLTAAGTAASTRSATVTVGTYSVTWNVATP